MDTTYFMSNQQIYTDPPHAMSGRDFRQLSEFITAHCGIKMPATKKIMLESRLQKRLRALKIKSFGEYCSLLFSSSAGEREIVHMIDAVTTNKTDFFREPSHFKFLTESAFPEFINTRRDRANRNYIVWSAGCSTGQEPYTLAITMSEFAAKLPDFQFSILATDISTKALETAQLGVYEQKQISMISEVLKKTYFMQSLDETTELVRVVPELRASVQFSRFNLLARELAFPEESVDAVFCRNVLIYFDQVTQRKILSRLLACLKQGGYLFLGHSETVHGSDLPIIRMASTIYKKN
jgi:chemotaxis protein methyltransferase CheR